MEQLIKELLDVMAEIADRSDIQWSTKKHMIEQALKADDRWERGWEEFMSWWRYDEPAPAELPKPDPKPKAKGK